MRILLVSDEESPYLWDYYRPGCLGEIDLILSAGDLKAEYLSFLVTVFNVPLLYVHGNHDGRYDEHPPEGCDCVDGRVVTVKGLRVAGLGGSFRYNDGPHQYTETQMRRRIARMRRKLRGGVDILLTHAPAAGYGDREDPAHRGFEAFLAFLDAYEPALMIHGHIHARYVPGLQREYRRGNTTLRNVCGYQVLELPDPEGRG